MKKLKNVRTAALDGLLAVEKKQAYSNLLLTSLIEKNQLPKKDIPLLTELIYGTLQRKLTLDYYIQHFIKGNKKLEDWVHNLLRLSIYQMVFLDRIPDRAVLHESVEIAKARGHKGIASFVNGVLRNVQRNGVPSIDEISNPIERIGIKTSTPSWLVKRLVEQYGLEEAEAILLEQLKPAKQTARINRMKGSIDEVIARLKGEGLKVEKGKLVPEAIEVIKGNAALTDAFSKGLLTIQDESSMLVAKALDVKEDDHILDSCAAPGGKTTHIAEMLSNTGKVISLDLHEHKVKLIEGQVNRLGLSNVETRVMDARKVADYFEGETFDKILVDAPCTGFGVIRRKPEIKYTKTEKDVQALANIQLEILRAVAPLVKPGGLIVYSTCTIDQEENKTVLEAFLREHRQFSKDTSLSERMPESLHPYVKDGELQILPHYVGSDGFYIAALRKRV